MKKGKGKAAKKAMKFAERKAKAEKWVAEYDGTPYGGDIIKAYRKKICRRPHEGCCGVADVRRFFNKGAD